MSDWIHSLPIPWMAIVVFAATWLGTAAIYSVAMVLAKGERARGFKAVSPGLLPPLGIIFGLLVAFLAAQAWGDVDRASTAVNREASALRAVALLSAGFPDAVSSRLGSLIARHIEDAASHEWPAMARRRATLGLFSTAVAVCCLLILAHDRPFTGQLAVRPDVLRR